MTKVRGGVAQLWPAADDGFLPKVTLSTDDAVYGTASDGSNDSGRTNPRAFHFVPL